MMHYTRFYGDIEPIAEIDDVEKCLINGGIDPDGIGRSEWIKALSTDDLPFYLYTHILQHKDDPAIKPLYALLREEISGILDKE
jgi:hypothetical protein